MLNARQQYETDGFVRLSGILDAELIASLKAEGQRLLRERANTHAWGGEWQRTSPHADPSATYTLHTVPQINRHSRLFDTVTRDPRILAAVEGLIGPCQLAQAMLIVKPAETGQPFPLHQDSAYYAASDPVYCIACLHLDTTTAENSALRFLPGLHRQGAIPHRKDGKAHLPPDVYRIEDTVEVCADAGDLVCFSHHTPHGSYPNRSSQPRMTLRLGYIPKAA